MSRGRLFVLSGPSGVGKGTVCKALFERRDDLCLSVSATTRAPRLGEVDGVHYIFLSDEEFTDWVENGRFLEWATYCDHRYGTPLHKVEELLCEGKDVLLEIELQGSLQVKQKLPESILIFVLPPSMSELRSRLVGRGTEEPEVIEARLLRAAEEMKYVSKYDYILMNDEVEKAVDRFSNILEAERLRTRFSQELIEEVLQS